MTDHKVGEDINTKIHPVHTFPSYYPRSIQTFSCHLSLGLPNGLFLQVFQPKFGMHFSFTHACYMYRLSQYPRFDHPNNI